MRSFITGCLIFFLIPSVLLAQSEEIEVPSEIEAVTVFLSGAQIDRTGSKLVRSGTHKLVLKSLSANVDPNSIKVKGRGQITILSVNHRLNFLNEQAMPSGMKALKDTLETLRFELKYSSKKKQVYNSERDMIFSNKKIGWEKAGFAVEDIEDLADFYRDRLSDIMLKLLEIEAKESKINEQVRRVSKQIQELDSKWRKSTSEVVVEIAANQTTTAKLEVSYLVLNAGWVPAYDLRSADIKEPIELRYNARVFQNTGVDWEKVKLTLSTSNPSQEGTKPELGSWYLKFKENEYVSKGAYLANSSTAISMDKKDGKGKKPQTVLAYGDGNGDPYGQTAADYTELSEGQTNLNFEIKLPYNIPADGEKHLVSVSNAGLPATYQYHCIPKMDLDAFLVAQISGWEKYNLLSGNANIYFEETFIGSSHINTNSTEKELDISMGRDKGIVVTRKRVAEFLEKKVVGGNMKETMAIEIKIRNTKSVPVEVLLEDQVPVSSNKEIQVEVEEITGAKHNEGTGILNWEMTIQPAETKTYLIRYSVKYPKDKEVKL